MTTRKWWHGIGDGDPQAAPDDDGLRPCPHCRQEGCARCQWSGVAPSDEPYDLDTAITAALNRVYAGIEQRHAVANRIVAQRVRRAFERSGK